MQKLLNKYAFFIPGLLLLIFCLIELWFFIFTPYSYFYSRGVNFPNVDYETTTYGDLTPEDIFITKQPRKARYVTDKYGSRNIDIPSSVDILILGESFGTGAGVSHEHTPAVQLSELTGLSSVVAPPVYDPLKSSNIFEKAVYTIRHSDPVKPKIILMIYIDLIKSIMAIQPICITNLRVALREFLQVASLLQDVELQQQQLLKHHQFQTLHGQV